MITIKLLSIPWYVRCIEACGWMTPDGKNILVKKGDFFSTCIAKRTDEIGEDIIIFDLNHCFCWGTDHAPSSFFEILTKCPTKDIKDRVTAFNTTNKNITIIFPKG